MKLSEKIENNVILNYIFGKPSLFQRLWIWCISEDSDVLAGCTKRERIRYSSLGISLLIPVVMTFVGFSYMLTTYDVPVKYSILLGTVMAFLVLIADRVILASQTFKPLGMDRNAKIAYYSGMVFKLTFRIVFSLMLSFLVSLPLKLYFFDGQIENYFFRQVTEEINKLEEHTYTQIANIENKIIPFEVAVDTAKKRLDHVRMAKGQKLEVIENEMNGYYLQYMDDLRKQEGVNFGQLISKEKEVKRLWKRYTQEVDGVTGTKYKGYGPEAKKKYKDWALQKEALEKLRSVSEERLSKLKSKQLYDHTKGRLDDKRLSLETEIEDVFLSEYNKAEEKMASKQEEIDKQKASVWVMFQKEKEDIMDYQARDLVARYEAFQVLAEKSRFMSFVGYLILYLFILLDTFPLIAKLTFGNTEYVEKQRVAFYQIHAENQNLINQIKQSII